MKEKQKIERRKDEGMKEGRKRTEEQRKEGQVRNNQEPLSGDWTIPVLRKGQVSRYYR